MTLERKTVHIGDDTSRITMLEVKTADTEGDLRSLSLPRFIYSNHLQSAGLELDENYAVISYEKCHTYDSTMKTNEELEEILIAKFYETYPKDKMPYWLEGYLNFLFYPNKNQDRLEFTAYLEEQIILGEGEYWENISGVPTRIRIDPETGAKVVVIMYEYKRHILFNAFLTKSLMPEIIQSIHINHLQKEDFVPRR